MGSHLFLFFISFTLSGVLYSMEQLLRLVLDRRKLTHLLPLAKDLAFLLCRHLSNTQLGRLRQRDLQEAISSVKESSHIQRILGPIDDASELFQAIEGMSVNDLDMANLPWRTLTIPVDVPSTHVSSFRAPLLLSFTHWTDFGYSNSSMSSNRSAASGRIFQGHTQPPIIIFMDPSRYRSIQVPSAADGLHIVSKAGGLGNHRTAKGRIPGRCEHFYSCASKVEVATRKMHQLTSNWISCRCDRAYYPFLAFLSRFFPHCLYQKLCLTTQRASYTIEMRLRRLKSCLRRRSPLSLYLCQVPERVKCKLVIGPLATNCCCCCRKSSIAASNSCIFPESLLTL